MKSFVVDERKDPLLVANADNHLQIVEKKETHNLTFEGKFLGHPTEETLRYADLRHIERLHDHLIKMGDGLQDLVMY